MVATEADTGKGYVIDMLSAVALAAVEPEPLWQVAVEYAFGPEMGAKCIYGGGWRSIQDDDVGERGVLVQEIATLAMYVQVITRPPQSVRATEAEAKRIASAMVAIFKTNLHPGGPLTWLGITAAQGDYANTGSETKVVQGFQVRFGSHFTW